MKTRTAKVAIDSPIPETVEIVKFGGGILSETVQVRRASGKVVRVQRDWLIWK